MLEYGEHILTGDWIKRELEKIDIVMGDIIVAYGDDVKEVELTERLRRTFRELRDALDNRVQKEYPESKTSGIYYGRPGEF